MITSKQNPTVKALRKLRQRKIREQERRYLIEGPHLVTEAIQAGAPIEALYATAEQATRYQGQNVTEIAPDVAAVLSETEHSQDVFAVVRMPDELESEPADWSPAVLLLDGVQDPGNLGTLVRTADAFGYWDIVLGAGSVDVYNPKVLRAMQGSHFHVTFHHADLTMAIPALQKRGYTVAATALDKNAASTRDYPLQQSGKWALVLGNEGNGVSQAVQALSDVTLFIPMTGRAESLNVAVAGAIVMYQFASLD